MKVTIVIPIKDFMEREAYASCLRQTFIDRSIIIHQMDSIKLDDDIHKSKMANCVRNRNELRKMFLALDSTHMLMMDSDVVLPENALEKLLEKNLPIVGGWHPMYGSNGGAWSEGKFVNGRFHHLSPQKGLTEVDMVCMGCILIRREVLEKVEFESGNSETILQESGSCFMGEHIAFARKCQALGYKLFLDGDVICKHLLKEQYAK